MSEWESEEIVRLRKAELEADKEVQELKHKIKDLELLGTRQEMRLVNSLRTDILQLEAALKDFATFGTRHDTNPTRLLSVRNAEVDASEEWWRAYFQSADNGVRDRARTALVGES